MSACLNSLFNKSTLISCLCGFGKVNTKSPFTIGPINPSAFKVTTNSRHEIGLNLGNFHLLGCCYLVTVNCRYIHALAIANKYPSLQVLG